MTLPDDFFALARRALGGGARLFDHTQARAVGELLGRDVAGSAGSVLDRALEAPTAWPRPWRSGAELALDLAGRAGLPGLAAFRQRSRARAEFLDRAVLAHLAAGGDLAEIPEALLAGPLHDLEGEPPPSGWRRLRARLAGGADAAPDEG
jgi:hypothetical protein